MDPAVLIFGSTTLEFFLEDGNFADFWEERVGKLLALVIDMPRPAVFSRVQFDAPSPPRPTQARGPAQIGGDVYAEDEAATTIWNPQQRFAQMQSPFDMFMPPPPPSVPAPRSMPSYPAVSMDAAPPSSRPSLASNGFNDPTMTVRKKSNENPLASIFTTHKWTTLGASALAASLATVIAVIALGAGAFEKSNTHRANAAATQPQINATAAQMPTYNFAPPQAVQAQAALPRAVTPAVAPLIVPAPIAAAPVVTASPLATNDAIAKDPSTIPTWRAQAPVQPGIQPALQTAQKSAPIAMPRVLTDIAPVDAKPARTARKDDETSAAQDALSQAKRETEGSLN